MDLSRIFTIGGKPGLQKLVAQSSNGVIVESLIDSKRFNASSSSKISSLEDISVFCLEGDKPLKEVFTEIGDKNKFNTIAIPEEKDLKSTLKTYLPTIDEERVYNSDVKKIFKWYNLLVDTKLLKAEEQKNTENKGEETKSKGKTAAKKKAVPKAKAATKKTSTPKTAAKKSAAVKSSAASKKG